MLVEALSGVEYFYIDTQHRVMDFPHKAVAMEIWRQQTLDARLLRKKTDSQVHVCSAFMQSDWKAPSKEAKGKRKDLIRNRKT